MLRCVRKKLHNSGRMVCVCVTKIMRGLEWLWRRIILLFFHPRARIWALVGGAGTLALLYHRRNDRGGESSGESGQSGQSALAEDVEAPPASRKSYGAVASNPQPAAASWRHEQEEFDFESKETRAETTDEFYCEYDSTWDSEDEDHEDKPRRSPRFRGPYRFERFRSAAKDMQAYRRNYPQKQWRRKQDRPDKPNLAFYRGERPSSPDDLYIHEFHQMWFRAYDKLEYTHTFIQWLFPLQEPGVNIDAFELTKDEIMGFLQDSTAKNNLLASYKLMLDFYGIKLLNETTGEVGKAENWKERFDNLDSHTHNNLRITRILKCLGTLGFSHYQAHLVHFFLMETLVHGELPNVKDSVLNYFMFAVRQKQERKKLIKFAFCNFTPKEEFVWCPKNIQRRWSAELMQK